MIVAGVLVVAGFWWVVKSYRTAKVIGLQKTDKKIPSAESADGIGEVCTVQTI